MSDDLEGLTALEPFGTGSNGGMHPWSVPPAPSGSVLARKEARLRKNQKVLPFNGFNVGQRARTYCLEIQIFSFKHFTLSMRFGNE
jgi:hypothetical protein